MKTTLSHSRVSKSSALRGAALALAFAATAVHSASCASKRHTPAPQRQGGSDSGIASRPQARQDAGASSGSPSSANSSPSGGMGLLGGMPPPNIEACVTDEECMTRLLGAIDGMKRPSDFGVLVAAECVTGDPSCGSAPVCHCVNGTVDGLAGAFAIGGDPSCDYYDRGGACVLPRSAFTGCDPSDVCSCVDQCERAFGTVRDAWARIPEFEARYAHCTDNSCRVVLRVDDRCYADFTPDPAIQSYDCSLPNDEIIRRAYAPVEDGGVPSHCEPVCRGTFNAACGIGVYLSRAFYQTCAWSMQCKDQICGTPECASDGDGGPVMCRGL